MERQDRFLTRLRKKARLGFERVAYFREVGHKFGRWLALVFMQRFLDAQVRFELGHPLWPSRKPETAQVR
jgi:hypothetical protein